MPSANEIFEEAVALKEAGKIEEAVAMLEGLIEKEPDHVLAYTGLSVFCEKLDRHEEAVAHARKVCELDPDDPFSHIAMSTICQKAGQIQEAELAMKTAMEKQWSDK